MLAERLEFLSEQYLEMLARAFEARAGAVHAELGERSFTLSEAYFGVPRRIAPTGELTWHVTFAGGRARFSAGEPASADVRLRNDYAATLPLARLVVDGDAAQQAELQRLIEEATAAGKFSVEGDLAGAPAAVSDVHDEMARLTA